MFDSIDDVIARLGKQGYIADREIATTVYLAVKLRKPMLLEGEAGAGKTATAVALALALDTRLIRLQCYEGLDRSHAVYEWNHAKQLLRIKLAEAAHESAEQVEREIFGEEYLVRRPLLEALTAEGPNPPVLLIDEVDRADEEFEVLLLDVLSEYQVAIPEMGTVKAKRPPLVVLTSNRTREINDALKRRCLYLRFGYPTFQREYEILVAKVPGISRSLAGQLCNFMERLRQEDFSRKPGIAETIDWGMALVALHRKTLDPAIADQTIGCILKCTDDIDRFRKRRLYELLSPAVDRVG